MNKNYILALSAVVLLAGCKHKGKDKNQAIKETGKKVEAPEKNVNIPLASSDVKSYFDDKDANLGEFVLVEDAAKNNEVAKADSNVDAKNEDLNKTANSEVALNDSQDFAWADADQDENGFKKCHYEFDRYEVKSDEETNVSTDIEVAKKMLAEEKNATVVIEGHACHAAGSRTYNMLLSEKRAQDIAGRFVAAGIPAESIKIVPRGQECPVKDKSGKEITGSKEEQWPNRRSEVRVICG